MERRSTPRFALNFPLKYSVVASGRVVARGRGRTLDLSSSGILIESEGEPMASGKIELSIAWPVALDGGTQLQLFVSGSLLRQEGTTSAVSLDRYEFRTRAAEFHNSFAVIGGRTPAPVPQM
jgi:hypothetical protein